MTVNVQERAAKSLSRGEPSSALRRLLARLPQDTRAALSDAQLAAIDRALDANNPTHHAVNLRVSLFGLAYVVVLCGREKRSPERRSAEREKHPLHTPGNIALLCGIAVTGMMLGYAIRQLVFGG